jgi:hypothetical protein
MYTYEDLVRQAISDAEPLVDAGMWVRIESLRSDTIRLDAGPIHTNGMHERPIRTVMYRSDGTVNPLTHW